MNTRLRRLRQNPEVRRLFQESDLQPRHLVQPYFVVSGCGVQKETRPGIGLWQMSADVCAKDALALLERGVGGIMLFGVPDIKDDTGAKLSEQLSTLQRTVDTIKKARPTAVVFADVCLCSFTTHGHCGIVHEGTIDNDRTLPVLADMSVLLARSGVDFVSPSDMMDGRVAAIREALDAASFSQTGILSYAVKIASAFYGPFRDAAHSAPQLGDRSSYQMPANNRREALRELALDEAEGADALLIKPAMTNLDLLRDARERTELPLFAYQVSGEIGMIRAAADAKMFDYDRAMLETLVSMRRAGADTVISYYARQWLV